jgi:uncharacterized protein (DUF1800 family)
MPNTLSPYTPSGSKPWNSERVQHLYQRLGFGADQLTIADGLALSPGTLVDQLIDQAIALPEPDEPYWADWTNDQYPNDGGTLYFQVKSEFVQRWPKEMLAEGIRSKMALFWHNHFVTEEDVYGCNSYMWEYYKLLHTHAFGNFRSFVEAMGLNPAMLVYLNGNQNLSSQPNENYARELMELFTMGENNGYTQTDIVEVSRALTGWLLVTNNCDTNVFFNGAQHDNGQKTIFGQTGNWGYDDVHEMIFTLRAEQTARYICEKLYKFFVHQDPTPEIIDGLAATFQQNNWELAPVLRQLLKSEHFFEERYINARIKSPLECLLSLPKLVGAEPDTDLDDGFFGYIAFAASELGQRLYNPVDVAGWPEYHSWLTENTLTNRWSLSSSILFGALANNNSIRQKLQQLAVNLTNPDELDVNLITAELVRHFLKKELDPNLQATAVQYFKGELPENYFEDGTWSLSYPTVPDQVINLLSFLIRLPEWQLC